MPLRGPDKKSGPTLTDATVSTFLLADAFVWYLSAFNFLQDAASSEGLADNLLLTVVGFNFLVFTLSAFFGTKLIEHFPSRKNFIKYWLLIGILISFLFTILNLGNFVSLMVLSGIIGLFFGIGMPAFMGYFGANTESQNRAKLGGLTVLLIVLPFAIITMVGISETILTSTILAVWLAIGLLFLSYFKPQEKVAEAKNKVSFRSVLSNKTFLLYIVPWLMFCLINDLTMQINANYFEYTLNFPSYYVLIENVLAGASAIVCGILADKKGRKRLALIGFALLGIGYASLGISIGNSIAAYAAWFYVVADGIAWGAFTTLFLITIWGDIALEKNSEKYYLIGVLPYLFSTFAGAAFGNVLSVAEITVFSFASFFLFTATLPLFYAPETLPEKHMKDRDLKTYIEKAQRIAQKEETKQQKHEEKLEPEQAEETSEEYKKAKELAEKYY